MGNVCCTSNLTIVSQSNKLGNTDLNDTKKIDFPCSTPKSHDSDISTSINSNITDEFIQKFKKMNKKSTHNHPIHSNSTMLLNICASSSPDRYNMSLDILPHEENERNEVNCSLSFKKSVIRLVIPYIITK